MTWPAPSACCSICSDADRLFWGSDWPVLTLAGTYTGWFALARDAIAAKPESAVPAVMGGNALRLYAAARHIHA